jgi:hypothetical protein
MEEKSSKFIVTKSNTCSRIYFIYWEHVYAVSGQYEKIGQKNRDLWFKKLNYFYKGLDNIKVESRITEKGKNEDITIPDAIINKTFNANIQKIDT